MPSTTRAARLAAALVALLAALAGPALAEGPVPEPIIVSLHKSRLIRLDGDAKTVVVSNPMIANVQVESPRLLILMGLSAGETDLIVLDGGRRPLLESSILVTSDSDSNVSIVRNCMDGTGCLPEEELSCAPRCVRVNEKPTGGAAAGAGGAQAGGGAASAPAAK